MPAPPATAMMLLRREGSVRSRDLEQMGIARAQLSRMVATGELVRLSRGRYALPGPRITETQDSLEIIAERMPGVRLCLLTALRLHGLTTQAPFEVWIAIGNKDRAPKLDWPTLRIVRFSGEALDAGLQSKKIGRRTLQVTNVPKTVADCFKFRSIVGLDVAIEALREALQTRAATVDQLWKFAKICRVTSVMRPYLEALA